MLRLKLKTCFKDGRPGKDWCQNFEKDIVIEYHISGEKDCVIRGLLVLPKKMFLSTPGLLKSGLA